ncbi:multiubiquitin domain-containing protein [Wenyingzhuangia aestuarii]|uniref:multiubiquitin domain-containing protein n=1 Tax=Wenyingzhuangia aestuarii TaxID=1647582 RepID=UPI0014389F58|nr:multiubiquitin domain-containing protein [Wenyingzhuangia aestuarii]NJB82051.1 hypothetical protein [Wenyingzhuangia aestuarii]
MQTFNIRVNRTTLNSPKQLLTGKEILELACLTPVESYELLLETNRKGYEPIQLTETVDLSDPGIEHFVAKLYNSINIFIDDVEYSVDECNSTPTKLLELAGYNNTNYYLTQIKNGDIEIGYKEQNDADHKISLKNGSRFCLHPKEENYIDINGTIHSWNTKTISYEQIIELFTGSKNIPPNRAFTITYHNGVLNKPKGSLTPGKSINVKFKMLFHVSETNQS